MDLLKPTDIETLLNLLPSIPETGVRFTSESADQRQEAITDSIKENKIATVGSLLLKDVTEGNTEDLLRECKRIEWANDKREERHSLKETVIEATEDFTVDVRMDYLLFQQGLYSANSYEDERPKDPLGHGSLIEEMEMKALDYIETNATLIDQRIGVKASDILNQLILFYEFGISYKQIGAKLSISERTVQRRIRAIQDDPLVPIECPLIREIIRLKAEKAKRFMKGGI